MSSPAPGKTPRRAKARPPLTDEEYLRRQREIVLTGKGRRTGKPHTVKLWFFSDDRHFYLMTYARRHGRGTDWYRNLRKQRSALIQVGERRYVGHFEMVEDPEPFLQQITEMFAGKYGWQLVRSYYTETKRIPIRLRFERAANS